MLGVCYYPEHWPSERWAEDARRMRELGLSYVRVGEFAWSRLEPEPGRLSWAWLDEAVGVLGAAGLGVVLGTPTATPPKWLVDRFPEVLPVDAAGRVRGFGSRRHYDFSSPVYREETERIVTLLAERYGTHDSVVGWQADNEYGCHDTVHSYSPAARTAFRAWLGRRYGDVGALNTAWGTVFWSQEYRDFGEVELPNLTVTEPNPAQVLDYRRFASDEVASYHRLQAGIIRRHSPGRFVSHNFMARVTDFDHFSLSENLDLAGWDSYPLGATDGLPLPDELKVRYARTGHPDIAAFHHDLYRRVGRGRWWVMEQQPGPVNWAEHNPAPAPGMVRLWTWEALAHGAEVVSYFRWRQAPFAQEQMHAGLNRPDNAPDVAYFEARRVAAELQELTLEAAAPARVALVFDYEAEWVLRTQPQGAGVSYADLAFTFYSSLRGLGLDVDVLAPGDPLTGYALVVVPSLPILTDKAVAALERVSGPVVFGPRTGSKTATFQIPAGLPPGPLQAALPIKVVRVESLRPGLLETVRWGGAGFRVGTWLERVESDLEPVARFENGDGAVYAHENRHYLAFWPGPDFLAAYLEPLAREAGLEPVPLPEGLRLRRRGKLRFAFNLSPGPLEVPAPPGALFALGGRTVEPYGVSAWREEEPSDRKSAVMPGGAPLPPCTS